MIQLVKAREKARRLIPAGVLVVLMLLGISVACYVVERRTTSTETHIKSCITLGNFYTGVSV